MSHIKVYGYTWVPPFAQGLVRDLRICWALKEAGQPYDRHLIHHDERTTDWYRALQPFGQVPAYEEGDIRMFESGAILLHVAEKSESLMPADSRERAQVQSWVLAALNSVEPPILNVVLADIFRADEPWAKDFRTAAIEATQSRLTDLAARLDDRYYLAGSFSAADLMMTAVLRQLRHTDLIAQNPVLDRYIKRCENRTAFQEALAEQMETFAQNEPTQTA